MNSKEEKELIKASVSNILEQSIESFNRMIDNSDAARMETIIAAGPFFNAKAIVESVCQVIIQESGICEDCGEIHETEEETEQ
jgi:hypothetical protein